MGARSAIHESASGRRGRGMVDQMPFLQACFHKNRRGQMSAFATMRLGQTTRTNHESFLAPIWGTQKTYFQSQVCAWSTVKVQQYFGGGPGCPFRHARTRSKNTNMSQQVQKRKEGPPTYQAHKCFKMISNWTSAIFHPTVLVQIPCELFKGYSGSSYPEGEAPNKRPKSTTIWRYAWGGGPGKALC